MPKKYLFFILIISILTICFNADAQVRNRKYVADEHMMALLDSNTLRVNHKLYHLGSSGDLNVYGFEETDIPVYADSVYAYRLSILESEIPLEYNEFVRPYIDLYTIKRRKLSSKVLSWSSYYFPMFEEMLDKEKMPLELKYLAVIESALNPQATSRVGAAGMWQFMAPTGRMYGLKTSNTYDERRDVSKSTEAAIKYLRNSYRIYGDWLLVIASYNCGPGNVNKAIKRAGGVKNFWAIQQYLPRETRGYVPAFIAATYMMNYAAEHNLYPSQETEIEYHTDTIQIDNAYTLQSLSAALDISIDELKAFNPSLRKEVIPFTTDKITLTLPYHKSILFTQLNASDTFKIATDNKLLAMHRETAKEHTKAGNGPFVYYKVKQGDLLGLIARKYNVTVAQLRQWNNIKGSKIAIGQKLKIKPNKA